MAKLADRLQTLVNDFPNRTVLVIGDLIADEFLYGEISRVSREAPVLVLNYHELVRLPGGAANAANNLLSLGCGVKVMGTVGKDQAGRDLVSTLARKGADVSSVKALKPSATPVKTRILAGAHHSAPQQLVRIDRVPPVDAKANRVIARENPPKVATKGLDGIVLSDYGYGTVTPALAAVLGRSLYRRRIPVVVDSRFQMSDFHGVTSITPNITELEAAVGTLIGSDVELLRRIGTEVLRKQRLNCLLVTQGRFGMTLFQPRQSVIHFPIFGSDEVADVTGAGDTVIAVFTLAMACGGAPEDAARLANYAGGIVVMKRGTATVSADELHAAITQDLS